MPNYELSSYLFDQAFNFALGVGMFSMSAAIAIGLYRKTAPEYKWLSFLLSLLFFSVGISRLFRAIGMHGYLNLVADACAALFAILAGILIWPLLRRSIILPKYQELQEAVAAIDEHKRIFQDFMDNSPAACFLEDEDCRLVYVNNAFQHKVGVQSQEVIGQPSMLWATGKVAQEAREQHRQTIEENRPVTRILYFEVPPGGNSEPWLVVRFPVPRTANGAVVGCIALNVAAEYERNHLTSKLANIVECSQDAIIGKDLEGFVTSWNRGAEELFGYSAPEIIGQSMSILVPPERCNELPECLDKIKRGIRVHDYETQRLCKQGQIKNVFESVSPILDGEGKIIGAGVIARDVTILKQQQRDITALNDQLKDRVYELAESNAALQSARDQALEASNLKSAFCANISHELRTPLTGILGLNELLLHNGRLQPDDLNLARIVQDSAEALLTVVNDILDLSKIEAGKIILDYAPFNPLVVLQDCTRLMAPSAHQKGLDYKITLDQNIPALVYSDASRLRQVLLNLIGNAIKFTVEGSVAVVADVVALNDDSVTIEIAVKDTGIGITPDQQRCLFMPFWQVDQSTTRKFAGTGLGLTISKDFVEMMDGKLVVESDGRGSVFTVRIAFDRRKLQGSKEFGTERMAKPGIQPIAANLATGRRILVVEDNQVLQKLALRQLQSLGIEAEVTMFGRDAIELAMTDRFDLILMDINLPDINGLEATAAIRNMEHSARRPRIPIVAMTAGAMKGDRERALESGMNDYLAKPVCIDLLKRTVELWLRKSPMRQFVRPPASFQLPIDAPPTP